MTRIGLAVTEIPSVWFKAFVLVCLLPLALGAGSSLGPLDELELRDQYGELGSLAAHRGQVVVVIIVTARRLRNIEAWERELRQRFDDLQVLRIADVPERSAADYGRIAHKLRDRVPEDVAVLIDADRRWASALDLDTDRPNLLIVDRDGRLASSYRGMFDDELAADVIAEIERLVDGS
ncbi:MAG: hypothetical protein JSV80_08715 [Acidobacteriota bacterium]|nr:MAG: hypothetical protein JSV80_08715 [Acidobacteriota bacterium]